MTMAFKVVTPYNPSLIFRSVTPLYIQPSSEEKLLDPDNCQCCLSSFWKFSRGINSCLPVLLVEYFGFNLIPKTTLHLFLPINRCC